MPKTSRSFIIESPGLTLDMTAGPLIMGVLNVTPDSFSDAGQYAQPAAAVAHGLQMIADGADIIDIGGESTRPGSKPVSPQDQISRVLPVIEKLTAKSDKPISIDTTSAEVARAALAAGAVMVNDISAARHDPAMPELLAETACPVVLMHMQKTPADMQLQPDYQDVVGEITAFLARALDRAVAAGVHRDRIIIDPGIGFGKTVQHNLQILHNLEKFTSLRRPLLLGTSRKSFIGKILSQDSPTQRIWGTAATVALAVAAGANILRVHDVPQMAQVAAIAHAIRSAGP